MTFSRIALVLVALLASRAPAEVGPKGSEFQVNTYTFGFQGEPGVAGDGVGNFVIVWQSGNYSTGRDGSSAGVSAQRYDASSATVGSEFVVNTYTTGYQRFPAVAATPSGDFVVAWQGGSNSSFYGNQQDGSASGVFVQRFDPAGAKVGPEFLANTTTRGPQAAPSVALDTAGNFVVVWESGNYQFTQDGSNTGIFGQRFDAFGTPLGPEFQVNTYTTGPQFRAKVASDALGNFVVVWQGGSYGLAQDGSSSGIFGRLFDSAGTPLGPEFQVNTYTTGQQIRPAIARDALGDFVVVWEDSYNGHDGSSSGIFGQRFDGSGMPIGGEFQVNTYTTSEQVDPSVATDDLGNFVVAWQRGYYGDTGDGSGSGIFGQHFSTGGVPLGFEFQVNTYTTSYQHQPRVGAAAGGDFVVAWEGAYFQDGSGTGVFGQRLKTTAFTAPELVAGNRVVLHDDPLNARKKSLSARADDVTIDLGGGEGSIDDPTLSGGHLRVRSETFDDTYDLPAANWRAAGTGPSRTYVYRDSALLAGPVKAARFRQGRFKVVGRGAQLQHSLAMNPDPLAIVLQLGDHGQRYCAVYGGTTEYKPDKVYRGRNAPAPSVCPR